MSITSNDKQFVANTYARFPIELVSGKGAILKDSNGKEYIVLDGLKAGDEIVATGAGLVREGAQIK